MKYEETRRVDQQKPKTPQKKDNEKVRGDPLRDLPDWLEEFTENLVDDSVPEHRDASSSPHQLLSEPRAIVVSDKHSIFTHFPKDRNCEICLRTKITRAPCRRRTGPVVPRAKNIGDLMTADHKVLSEGCESRHNHRYAAVVQDMATQWITIIPMQNKTSQETENSLQKFLEPARKPKVIYADNSIEFGKSCEDLPWNHCRSTPHRSETNGIAERAVRKIKEGTSAVLLQSDLDEKWWADYMECSCYLRNIQDLLSDEKTPHEMRFGAPFKGPVIPFGAMVEYHHISDKDLSRLHQFGSKVLPGKFLGHALHAGWIWKGDILVANIGGIGEDGRIWNPCKKTQCKGSVNAHEWWKIIFLIADGTVKLSGGDQVLRTSTLIRDRPDRGEGQGNLQGESDGSSSTQLQDLSLCDGEARKYFWSSSGNYICRHDVEPRVSLYVPREASFPILLKYIDVTRATSTSLDVMLEKTSTIIGTLMEIENCQIRGQVSQGSLCWIDIPGPEGDWPESKRPPDQTLCGQRFGKDLSEASKGKEKQKWAIEKPRLHNARKLRGIHLIDPAGEEFKDIIPNARRMWKVPMPAAMPCKTRREKCRETFSVEKKCKTKHASVVEADESTRERMEGSLHKDHEDHIAGKGMNSLSGYNLVHTFLPMPQAKWKYQMRKLQWTKNGKILTRYPHGRWRKSETKMRWSLKQGMGAEQCILRHWWTSVILRIRSWSHIFKIHRPSGTPRWQCTRWFRLLLGIYRARFICVQK